MRERSGLLVAVFAFAVGSPPGAGATLAPVLELEGRINWSLDAGSDEDFEPRLQVLVPPGSTVQRAILYSSVALHTEPPPGTSPRVVLDGVAYEGDDFTPLEFVEFPPPFDTGMQAFRADATAQITSLVGAGSEAPFSVPIDQEEYAPAGRTTGTLLAVVYMNPAEVERRIVLAEGGADPGGDAFSIDLGTPEGSLALLSLGIGFSTGNGGQKTEVEIGGRRLTSVAGGTDDSRQGLTVGGIGDSPQNPPDPFAAPLIASSLDDELYDLSVGNGVDSSPFLGAGATSVTIATLNRSDADNLFFAGINIVQAEPSVLEIPSLGWTGRIVLALLLWIGALGVLGRLR